ncbi:hypothetical protein quinque_013351 [Culex quinquefasciatus]
MNEDTRELAADSRYYYFIHPPRHHHPHPNPTTEPPNHRHDGLPWDDFWNNDLVAIVTNSSNTESLLTSPESALSSSEQTQLLLYDIFIPLLGALIIGLNLAVVISSLLLLRKGQQPYTTYLFLGNVAAADLLTGFAVIYGQYAPREIRGEDNCAILIGLIVSTTLVSVYSVGLIAVDRYLYIMYGLQYQRYITPGRARLLIVGTWLLGLVVGFLPAFGWRGDTEGGRICWFIRLAPPPLVILTTVLGIIPVLVVIVLYSIILHKAIRRVAQLKKASREQQGASLAGNLRLFRGGGEGRDGGGGGQSTDTEQPLAVEDPTRRSSAEGKACCGCCGRRPKTSSQPRRDTTTTGKNPTRRKAIKVVMLTTGCFVVTWLPYFIASTMFVLCDPATSEDLCRGLQFAIASPLAILGFTNSLLNPVIYAWWHQGFRNAAKRLWARACPCCQRQRRSSYKSSSQDSQGGPVPAPRTTTTTTTTSSSSGEASVGDLPRGSTVTTSTGVVSLHHVEEPTSTSFRRNNSTNSSSSTFKPVPHHRSAASSDLENRITTGATPPPPPVPSIRQMPSSTTTRL